MPAWVLNWLNNLRSSLWLIPSCMAMAAIFLSMVVPYLDVFYSPKDIDSLRWLSNMGPEGAMTLLSTIAGSMITIAGVVFSITIVALTRLRLNSDHGCWETFCGIEVIKLCWERLWLRFFIVCSCYEPSMWIPMDTRHIGEP